MKRDLKRPNGSFAARASAFFVTLVLCIGAIPIANAATYVVTKIADTNDGTCSVADCSLREAVRAANGDLGADTLTLPAGTYDDQRRAGAREGNK